MYIQPYLFFDGRCQEALDYYVSALGAKVEMAMKFKDSPEPPDQKMAQVSGDNIMHASFRIGDTVVMASDGFGKGKPVFQGVCALARRELRRRRRPVFLGVGEGRDHSAAAHQDLFRPELRDGDGQVWRAVDGDRGRQVILITCTETSRCDS